ncbi:MAG: dTMP kinase [Candidatus Bipolaricaulota bacterium]
MAKGYFIALEGIDGSGKTTQANLLGERLAADGYQVIRVQEPGGTPLGRRIRKLLLNSPQLEIEPLSELLLYEASRAQLVRQRLIPALQQGKIVISDRFALSSIAYQGHGRGIPEKIIESLNELAVSDLSPDLTILLDISLSERERRKEEQDRIEQEDREFYKRVIKGFRQSILEKHDHLILDGAKPKNQLHDYIYKHVQNELLEHYGEPG